MDTLELIDPHWITALTRDDGAVVVRRSIRLTDGDVDTEYPELVAEIMGRELLSSATVSAPEMFGGKAVATTYGAKVAA